MGEAFSGRYEEYTGNRARRKARAGNGNTSENTQKIPLGVMPRRRGANHVPVPTERDDVTRLIQRHAGLIHKIALAYCRDGTDREDVVQEIAVNLWRAWPRYDGRHRETTWIYRIALNVAISFHRRERRHRAGRQALDDSAAALAFAPEAAPPSGDVALLLRCIGELAPLERALVLLDLDGNDHATIADVLGISVSNVGTKLWRVRNRLRAALGRCTAQPLQEDEHGPR